ncbi:MAG: PAS domain-containing sensor histidine kinase [Muribaculaceae bacterium]|nr:PAS domain-containing sensor histidine kinase [Muribaculaceae bacterium]
MLYPKLIKAANVPAYTVVDNSLGSGFVGGYMITPYSSGTRAAQTMIDIWNGLSASPLSVINSDPIFNEEAIDYWKYDTKDLPEGAEIINDWRGYFQRNKQWIIAIGVIILVFVSTILIMMYFRIIILKKNKELDKLLTQKAEHDDNLNLALEAGGLSAWVYDIEKDCFMNLQGEDSLLNGVKLEQTRHQLHPDDIEQQKQVFADMISGKKDKDASVFRYKNTQGVYLYYEIRMVAKKTNGIVTHITGTQKDITDKIDNTEKIENTIKMLRFSIGTADMALWAYDCRRRMFTLYNEPIVDYKDGVEMDVLEYINRYHIEESPEKTEEIRNLVLEQRNEKFSVNVKFKTVYNQEWQFCVIKGEPVEYDKEGNVTKYLGVRINNTTLIKYQRRLESEKIKAEQADRLKSAFLANMSHEIRTPLNAIVGFSDLLQSTDDPEERSEYMSIINHNSDQLLHLINDILDLSKIESGAIELSPQEFDLTVVLKDLVATADQNNKKKDMLKIFSESPYLKCNVNLDRKRLVQVWTNFTTNAIKYTPSGSIIIGYEYVNKGIKIFVSDTGIGIPADKHSRIFHRFEKLDDFAQGSGLGLSICKAIVDASNGKIGFKSVKNQGSTFWAWFPGQADITFDNPD